MRQIEIDFDVHKIIESNRTGFEDTPNDVLRRLLGLNVQVNDVRKAKGLEKEGAWLDGVVELPPFTELKMVYNNREYFGIVRDGAWHDDMGGVHHSPSGAACALARTKDGKKTNLNGKNYWYVKRPGEDWILYSSLEQKLKRMA
jgi:hypothetical protein